MGTWDAGNFDNDEALDFVGELIDQLCARVAEWFSEENPDIGDGGEGIVMPVISILSLLTENCGAAPPKPEVVTDWSKRYLKYFDEQIDDYDPDESFKKNRRKVIAKTFKSLEEASAKFWSGSAGPASSPEVAETDSDSLSAESEQGETEKLGVGEGFRRFEFTDEKSNKFWEIKLDGASFKVRYGRIGTAGQEQTKNWPTTEKALKEYEKLVDEKLGKGYEEV